MVNVTDKTTTCTLKLSGLDCADCAAKLEKRVAALPGATGARVNFTAGTLAVAGDVAPDLLTQTIKDAGYSITGGVTCPLTSSLRVSGIDCPDCAAALTGKLRAVDGVEAAELNIGTGLLTVRGSVPPAEVIRLVAAAGYRANPAAEAAPERDFLHSHLRLITTILSGIFLIAAWLLARLGVRSPYPEIGYVVTILVGGVWTFRRGWASLLARQLDMNVLMSVAVTGAVLIGQWSEGATVAVLYSLSNLLESYTMEKTRQSIRGLMEEAPREALVRRDGEEMRLPVEEIHVGDLVIIRPGEKIAVDGLVAVGNSSANQAAITGESVPVEKGPGDEVFAGTLNEMGVLEVRVVRDAEDTALAKIIHLVEEAQARRAPAQALVDRFAKYYTPAVIALAALLAVVPPLFTGEWHQWIYRALTLVVVACPCALVISTPVAIVAAIGNAARHGVLIKGGAYLEQAGKLSAIAFDKTGTLTSGRPEVTDILPLNGTTPRDLLAVVAAVEARSPHPLAQAILRRAEADGVGVPAVEDAVVLPGKGVQGKVDGRTIYVGTPRLFTELGVDTQQAVAQLAPLYAAGKTVMLIGDGSKLLGLIAAADGARPDSRATLRALRAAGIKRLALLTGDHQQVAAHIAAELGVDDVLAELLPDEKVDAIQRLAAEYGTVGMVGDGINDAPALAAASVGIAMGAAGTDTAMETADITLMADDLCKLPYTIRLSRKTMAIIRQNIAFSLLIKALALALIFPGWLTLWLAVLADMGASIAVTLNALRLVAEQPDERDKHQCG
ncbi:MAG TPA: heavy metal translocating P-type ATPase [Armatimonadota bacterium]|jgi:Cd2+/Zn2+-exporting ATPase